MFNIASLYLKCHLYQQNTPHPQKNAHQKINDEQLKYRLWVPGCKFWERSFCVWTFQYCLWVKLSLRINSLLDLQSQKLLLSSSQINVNHRRRAGQVMLPLAIFWKFCLFFCFWAIIGFSRRDLWGEMTQTSVVILANQLLTNKLQFEWWGSCTFCFQQHLEIFYIWSEKYSAFFTIQYLVEASFHSLQYFLSCKAGIEGLGETFSAEGILNKLHFHVKSQIASNLNSGSSGPTSREKNIKNSEATGRPKSNAKSKEYKKVIFKLRGEFKKRKQTVGCPSSGLNRYRFKY